MGFADDFRKGMKKSKEPLDAGSGVSLDDREKKLRERELRQREREVEEKEIKEKATT